MTVLEYTRVVVKDPFNPKKETDVFTFVPGRTVAEVIPAGMREKCVVSINGGIIPANLYNTAIVPGDFVLVKPIVEGNVGKIFIGSALIAAGLILAVPSGGLSLVLSGVGYGLWFQGVAGTFFAPNTPQNKKLSNDSFANSPTYSLDGFSNTYINGLPIPILYGKHRVGGQVISQFKRVNDNGQTTLYVLLALSHGPIKSIAGFTQDTDSITGSNLPSTIELNGSSITLYADEVRASIRLGGWNQDPIPGFQNIVSTQDVGTTLAVNVAQTLTTQAPCSSFEVNILHPAGLYKASTTGATQQYTVTYQIRWRETGGSSWAGTKSITVAKETKAIFSSVFRMDAPLGNNPDGSIKERILDVEVTRTSAADTTVQISTIQWDSLNEIHGADLAYPGIALLAIEAIASDQLSGGIPTITSICEGRIVNVWDGVSETAPVFSQKYDDGVATKTDSALTVSSWVTLGSIAGTDDARAFQFYTAQARTLNGLVIKMRRASADVVVSGNVYVEIQTNSASGQPSGTVVATSPNYDAAKIKSGTGQLVPFAFENGISLSAGAPYHAVVKYTYTASVANHIQIAVAQASGGNYDLETLGGVSWLDSSTLIVVSDLFFKGQKPGENPAWWTLDFLLNDVYGLGAWVSLNDVRPFLSDFLSWANYCDDCFETYRTIQSMPGPRWAGGINIDVEGAGWEHALKLASVARATLIAAGAGAKPIADRPMTFNQFFSEGNIKIDSALDVRIPTKDKYNRFELQFANEEIGYNKDPAIVEDKDSLATGEVARTQTGNIFGLTAPWRAYSAAQYRVNQAKYINRAKQITAALDAVATEPGDVNKVVTSAQLVDAAGVTPFGGRVVIDPGAVTVPPTVNLWLDRFVATPPVSPYQQRVIVRTTVSGVEYIQERQVDDYLTWTTPTGLTYTKLKLTSAWTHEPQYGDPYTFLPSTTDEGRLWRCASTVMNEDFEVALSYFNYDTRVFNDDPGDIEAFTDELPRPGLIQDSVENLTLSETHQTAPDGSLISQIEVSFSKPNEENWAEVFYRISGDASWIYHGRTQGYRYTIFPVEQGVTYQVAVRVTSAMQSRESLATCPNAFLSIYGPWAPPGAVTNLAATQNINNVLLTWTEPATASAGVVLPHASGQGAIAGYEIRRGLNWNTGEVLGRTLGNSFVTFRVPYNNAGTFWVAAYTRGNVYSTSPQSVAITGVFDYMPDILNADQGTTWGGTKTNCTVTDGILNCNDSTAVYSTAVIDTGAQKFYRLSVELGLLPNDGGDLTWDEATFTWDSDQAARRMWNGWAGNPINKGPSEWALATDTWDSWFGNYMTWAGPLDFSNRTTVLMEWSGSVDNISYTSFAKLTNDGEISSYRYYKLRATMTGDLAAETHPQRIALASMKIRISTGRILDSGSVTTSTGGAVAVTFSSGIVVPAGFSVTIGQRQASGGQTHSITAPTSTGFSISQFNEAGSRVAITVYWHLIV